MLGEKHTHKRIRRNIPHIHKDYHQCLLLLENWKIHTSRTGQITLEGLARIMGHNQP